MRLALDHHYSPLIAVGLRARGQDALAAVERGWHELSDEDLLACCASEGRTLVTNNVGDLVVVARRLTEEGSHHAGLVFGSDASLPRTRATIGRFVDLLEHLMAVNPGEASFIDRIHWLS